jgi:hypothetical protein
MSKLRLDLDAVVVESFPTVATPAEMRGTVEGREGETASDGAGLDGCTVGGCSGDGNCSWDMGCSREQCSDACTGYPGCSNDGNCSELEGCTGLTVCFWTP